MNCENESQAGRQVTLKVNDRDIALNTFAASMFVETVLGMLRPLRDTGDVQKVNLEIRCAPRS